MSRMKVRQLMRWVSKAVSSSTWHLCSCTCNRRRWFIPTCQDITIVNQGGPRVKRRAGDPPVLILSVSLVWRALTVGGRLLSLNLEYTKIATSRTTLLPQHYEIGRQLIRIVSLVWPAMALAGMLLSLKFGIDENRDTTLLIHHYEIIRPLRQASG